MKLAVLCSPSTRECSDIERGGQATYHDPEQLVGYTIFHLHQHQRKLRILVENLEEVFIRLLEGEFGIAPGRDDTHRGRTSLSRLPTAA